MATPQTENGHFQIANEIAEALCKVNLSAYESRLLWFILRRTYGWQKKTDRISFDQFQIGTGIKRQHIQRTLKSLTDRNIIIKTGQGHRLFYGFEKNYEQWHLLPKEVTKSNVTHRGYKTLPKEVTNLLPKEVTTKEMKETIKRKQIKTLESIKPENFRDNPEFAGINIESELVKFRDYLKAKGKRYKDYPAAFRNWLRNTKIWNKSKESRSEEGWEKL